MTDAEIQAEIAKQVRDKLAALAQQMASNEDIETSRALHKRDLDAPVLGSPTRVV